MKKENLSDWIRAIGFRLREIKQRIDVESAERQYNCDFGGHIYQNELGYKKGQGYDYTPSFNHFHKLCGRKRLDNNDSVMDLGCGKGYAMYLLGMYSFKNIYGIEKNKMLAEIAKSNCKKLNNPSRYQVLAEDVLDAFKGGKSKEIIDKTNYFYIYNSFPRNIIKQVILSIEQSGYDNNRDVTLWYVQPDKDCLDIVLERVTNGKWMCTLNQKSHGESIYEFKLTN